MPRNSLVDVQGQRGVFLAGPDTATFRPVQTGLESENLVEVLSGVADGDRVDTLGAAALRDGDKIVLPGAQQGGGRGPNRRPQDGASAPVGQAPGPRPGDQPSSASGR